MVDKVLDLTVMERVLESLRRQGYEVPPTSTFQEIRAQVPSSALARALAEATGHEYVDLEGAPLPDTKLIKMAPRGLLEEGTALPYRILPTGTVQVLIADPTDQRLINNVRSRLKRPVSFAVADPILLRTTCLRVVEAVYGPEETLASAVPQRDDPIPAGEQSGALLTLNRLVETAVLKGATDIHLERLDKYQARIRYRIDGQLVVVDPEITPEKLQAVINAIKIRAGMDPAVATEAVLNRLARSRNNLEFLETLAEDL